MAIRCARSAGKDRTRWRCNNDAKNGLKYCEKHRRQASINHKRQIGTLPGTSLADLEELWAQNRRDAIATYRCVYKGVVCANMKSPNGRYCRMHLDREIQYTRKKRALAGRPYSGKCFKGLNTEYRCQNDQEPGRRLCGEHIIEIANKYKRESSASE